jgi:hypothetical protein
MEGRLKAIENSSTGRDNVLMGFSTLAPVVSFEEMMARHQWTRKYRCK